MTDRNTYKLEIIFGGTYFPFLLLDSKIAGYFRIRNREAVSCFSLNNAVWLLQ